MLRYTLCDKFEVSGHWWIRGLKSNRAPGNLLFGPDDLVLSIDGVLKTTPMFQFDGQERTIFGEDAEGNKFTLHRAMQSGLHQRAMSGYSTSRYVGQLLLVGGHFSDLDKPLFLSSRIKMSGLDDSFAGTGFTVKYTNNFQGVDVSWRKPGTFSISVPSERCTISSDYSCTYPKNNREIDMKQATWLRIKKHRRTSADWFIQKAYQIGSLFALLNARSTPLTELILAGPGASGDVAQIYFRQSAHDPDDGEAFRFDEILVPVFKLTTTELNTVINQWFSQPKEVGIVTHILCSSFESCNSYHHVDFINLVQALEAYHRAVSTSAGYMEETIYEQQVAEPLRNAIPSTVSRDHRQRLEGIIKYGFEYSQRKRLKELVSSMPEPLRKLLVPDFNLFLSRVVDTRNYFIHFSSKDCPGKLGDFEIYFAKLGLQLILASLILLRLGVPARLLEEQLPDLRLYRRFKHKRAW